MTGDPIVVGRIGRPHGVRGAVVVAVTTDDPTSRFAAGSVLDTDPSAGPLTVVSARRSGPVLVVSFAEVADRDAAAMLRGTALTVDAGTLPELSDPEEFYDHQLISLAVVDDAGTSLGRVTDVMHPPASSVLVVATEHGEVLVPFVTAIVPTVDIAGGRLVVTPPDGMFE